MIITGVHSLACNYPNSTIEKWKFAPKLIVSKGVGSCAVRTKFTQITGTYSIDE